MSYGNSPAEAIRHPLGMPPGSVRGILSLLIVIQFWLLLLLPEDKKVPIPINLYLLLSLVGLFFVSHGKSIANAANPTPSPLYLPGGTLRAIIFGGTAAVLGYLYSKHPEWLMDRLRPDSAQLANWPYLLGAYVGGFSLGYIFRHMPFRNNWLFQSFIAWMAMLAMALLFVEIILKAFIQSTLKEHLDLTIWETIVTGITTCYFGTRS